MKIIVLAKQVPDTRHVGKDAMKEDGTINRGALPAIFNPDDLHALEQALRIKEVYPDTEISILTMGPDRAADILREALYRGADKAYLLTDRAFAGADTLATSYALAAAIRHIGMPDLILGGRQAIDGDTAQVGPQVAHKLGWNAVTYAEEILSLEGNKATILRRLEHGTEVVKAPLPLLVTVTASSAPCRSLHAIRVQRFKYARTESELKRETKQIKRLVAERPYLRIVELSAADVHANLEECGLSGSPTKVKGIQNVSFKAKESKRISATEKELEAFIKELVVNHTIG